MDALPTKKFQRRKEDFACEKCGHAVKGSGYTNHCPKCLTSKHVDIYPGDRAASCGGMMEPVSVGIEKNEHFIAYRCLQCGHEKRNKVSENDDFDAVLRVAQFSSTASSVKNPPA